MAASTLRDGVERAIREHLQTYRDLNSSTIEELHEMPSALEFMRYVAQNRPFVVRRGAADFKACRVWDADYLRKTLQDSKVNIALTPHGNADSIIEHDGQKVYVEPYEETRSFDGILDYIQHQEQDGDMSIGPVMYAQTQNDNLRSEYASLFADVPKSIDFARIALQKEPDAVNCWLGNSRSVTSLHRDNYENVYVQVRGAKRFLLLPPVAVACVDELELPRARYRSAVKEDQALDLDAVLLDPVQITPIPSWDPDTPESSPRQNLVDKVIVTLEEGDVLYLPALWYHKVSQLCGPEHFCCSVNYWSVLCSRLLIICTDHGRYDLDHTSPLWSSNCFVRDMTRLLAAQGEKRR